jgi:hypothetical protein
MQAHAFPLSLYSYILWQVHTFGSKLCAIVLMPLIFLELHKRKDNGLCIYVK